MAAYFEACLEEAEGDAAFIAKALGGIARAEGMAQVARDAGLSRESLYKALSGERGPDFETILKVVGALGLELHAKVARKASMWPEAVLRNNRQTASQGGKSRKCGWRSARRPHAGASPSRMGASTARDMG
jgi:probable addiction module antidote protein